MKESKAGNNEASATKADDAGKYPGVAIDVADGDETNAADVKERTLTLGFNPRNEKKFSSPVLCSGARPCTRRVCGRLLYGGLP